LKISDYSYLKLKNTLAGDGLFVQIDPFVLKLRSDVEQLVKDISLLYADFETQVDSEFADFHVEILHERGIRHWFNPLVRFFFDGQPAFIPLPLHQCAAMLEWGLNWCVAAHAHQYLVIHAALVEKSGVSILMPAAPGSGKSTLCAALVLRGWRLLSDELALLELSTGFVFGMARPINLKNESINIIKQFAPSCLMTKAMEETSKGTVALMKPPSKSVLQKILPVSPTLVISPKYSMSVDPGLELRSKARTMLLIAEQSFNFDILGVDGFDTIATLLDQSICYQLTFRRLDHAIEQLDALLESQA
jgi:hypothetical protein